MLPNSPAHPATPSQAENSLLECLKSEAPDVLSALQNKDKPRRQLISFLSSHMVMKHHQGPIPSPDDLAAYNTLIPNGADRIMTMAEKQSSHRRAMEAMIVPAQIIQSSRGQLLGFAIGICGILAAVILTLRGHDWVGGTIGGATVVSLVVAFITGQRSQEHAPDSSKPPHKAK